MCGIAGIFNLDGRPADAAAVTAMTRAVAHRGPDGEGIWVDGPVGLGHRRLAIRDLSEAGRQPMASADAAAVLTFNGEIYNDRQLRGVLEQEGCRFFTACDAEIIAPAYRRWGIAAFARLEGMYALALWDAAAHELVLARDGIGIKPLYYSFDGSVIRFASEVKALLALPDQERALCPDGLHRFLAQGYPGPGRSLLRSIRPLPPGSVLIAGRAGVRQETWWRPKRTGEIRDEREALATFLPLWRDVVADHLISDVPVGLLLSGGIDSGLIAAALRDMRADDGVQPVAYTARFASVEHDEFALARQSAGAAGLRHEPVPVDTDGQLEEVFRRVVRHFDGQCADSSGLAFFLVCEAARRSLSVLLSGDGADEFFGGYETYAASRLAAAVAPVVPSRLAGAGASVLSWLARGNEGRPSFAEKGARLLSGIAAPRWAGGGAMHPQWRRYLGVELQSRIYGTELGGLAEGVDALDDYATAMGSDTGASLIDRCLLADQTHYLPGDMLLKVDNMSMAHGMEIRVPFLDRRIMSFAGTLDAGLLAPPRGPTKRILRAALTRAGMPTEVISGRKRGFQVPVSRLLRTALAPLGRLLLDRDADILAPFLKPDGVRGLWRAHHDRQANHGYVLWTLLTLAEYRRAALV